MARLGAGPAGFSALSGGQERPFSFEPHEAAHIVGEIGKPDPRRGPGNADRTDNQVHRSFLLGEDILDGRANLRLTPVGNARTQWHRLALRLFHVDARHEAVLGEMRLDLRRPVGGIGPNVTVGVFLVEHVRQPGAVMRRRTRHGPGADQTMAAIDADVIFVAEVRNPGIVST